MHQIEFLYITYKGEVMLSWTYSRSSAYLQIAIHLRWIAYLICCRTLSAIRQSQIAYYCVWVALSATSYKKSCHFLRATKCVGSASTICLYNMYNYISLSMVIFISTIFMSKIIFKILSVTSLISFVWNCESPVWIRKSLLRFQCVQEI